MFPDRLIHFCEVHSHVVLDPVCHFKFEHDLLLSQSPRHSPFCSPICWHFLKLNQFIDSLQCGSSLGLLLLPCLFYDTNSSVLQIELIFLDDVVELFVLHKFNPQHPVGVQPFPLRHPELVKLSCCLAPHDILFSFKLARKQTLILVHELLQTLECELQLL